MRWKPRIVASKTAGSKENKILDAAIAIGEEAAIRAIDRALVIRRTRRALYHATQLLNSGRIQEARTVIEMQLSMMKEKDER